MVTLEGSIQRYIGLSTDEKPRSTATEPVPAGSSFFETDTWRIARWDGTDWRYERDDVSLVTALQDIKAVLVQQRELLEAIEDKL